MLRAPNAHGGAVKILLEAVARRRHSAGAIMGAPGCLSLAGARATVAVNGDRLMRVCVCVSFRFSGSGGGFLREVEGPIFAAVSGAC